jgi:N-acetylglucosamine-6-sulfatase
VRLIAFIPGLVLAGLLGAAAPATTSEPRSAVQEQQRPNVVVIETDDQTLESVRVMRNVRRLIGDQGTTFENNFASFSLCCPSRATFLTGQYAHNHGVQGNSPPDGGYERLDHSSTLAVWLQRSGYYTAEVGKYLNGYGQRSATVVPPGWSEWHAAVKNAYFGHTLNENGSLLAFGSDTAAYQTDVFARRALDVIRRRAPAEQPFFLWFTPYAPHAGGPRDADDPPGIGTPSPAPRHRNIFSGERLPRPPSFNEADVADKPAYIRQLPRLSPRRIAAIQENYQQRLETLLAVDEAVGAIVAELQRLGELDRTLVVFTSDNGFFHGEHRVPFGKVLVYEPSIRVPLLMRGPGVPRGLRLRQLVANIDLAPTILDAANATPGRRQDGRSLLPLLARPALQWGRDLLIEGRPEAGRGRRRGTFDAIRTPRYLYAEYTNGDRELYDLVRDPNELRSRHADPSLAPLRAELARRLAFLRECRGSACLIGPRVALSVSCGSGLSASVGGLDARWIASVAFVAGSTRAVDRQRPFRADLGPPRASEVSARVALVDGRRVELEQRASGC